MLKKISSLFAALLLLPMLIQAFSPGFNKEEMRDMIAICNSFTFIDLYKSDEAIIPRVNKVYTSGVFGMDNRYQVYKNGNVAVINFRGSTAKQVSWLENIYASMIPAKGAW
ncbi:MAG: hypothetical protein R2847_07085 [Bacteroidia bacterium]